MTFIPGRASRTPLRWVAAGLFAFGWLAGPAALLPAFAAPAVQVEATATPRPSPSPAPTRTREQELQDATARKLDHEVRLIDLQRQRVQQEIDTDRQTWRAPAEAVASFGPTLVGIGLLYLLARALSHWLPPAPARPGPPDQGDLEGLEEED